MAIERLSRFQKWALQKCLKDLFITRSRAKEFYGHMDSRSKKFMTSNSERITIHRSLNILFHRGLLYQPEGWRVFCLTELGFLKVNRFHADMTIVNFKDYDIAVNRMNEERKKYIKFLRDFSDGQRQNRGNGKRNSKSISS